MRIRAGSTVRPAHAAGAAAAGEAYLYDRVAGLVKGMVEDGSLAPGDRVPSLRRMSRRLGVSVSTVMQAYTALEGQGWLEVRPQSGYYVRTRPAPDPDLPGASRPRSQPRRVQVGDTVSTILAAAHQPGIVPLAVADPDPALLPVRALNRALVRALGQAPEAALQYCFPPGAADLRRQIALRSTGVGCEIRAEDVIVTTGATEALAASLTAVAKPGDVVAVESPVYYLVLLLIERLGMRALEVGADPQHGLDLDALEAALGRVPVRAVVSVANFHNPLGSLMPAENKARLVGMLAARDVPLIEDDIYGDLHFGETRPALAKAFDRKGLVLTCSSFSKTLAPGYRVGWVLPGRFFQSVMRSKQVMSSATASATQLAVAEFLATGGYDRHLRRLRQAYRGQVERMREAVARHFPEGTRVTRPQGGFVLWVELPAEVDGMALYERALAEGVSIAPGALFSAGPKYRHFIRLSAGHAWDETIAGAVARVGELAREAAGGAAV